jgi:hypothetical protein
MKPIALRALMLMMAAVLVGCGGGGDTPESLGKEMMGNFRKMAEILEGVTDEASAKAAVPKIEAVRASMRDIAKRSQGVKTDAERDRKMMETMGPEMAELQGRMMAARERLMEKPELMAILEPAMTGMENDL